MILSVAFPGLLTYAFSSNGNFVHIDKVINGLACDCFCPSCKERLVAKNEGTKRIHHFAHASGVDCDEAYETMLHQLAKYRVQEAFITKEVFNLQFEYRSHCPHINKCGFIRYSDCHISSQKVFNLKEFYDSCEQERQYDSINRRSDLKIFSSKNPQLAPIYIEFYVTHASDSYKLHNGGKISDKPHTAKRQVHLHAQMLSLFHRSLPQSSASAQHPRADLRHRRECKACAGWCRE